VRGQPGGCGPQGVGCFVKPASGDSRQALNGGVPCVTVCVRREHDLCEGTDRTPVSELTERDNQRVHNLQIALTVEGVDEVIDD